MRYTSLTLTVLVTGAGQAVADAVAASTAGVVDRVCLLVPGEVAWDNCECGQLAQTITDVYPSVSFPTPASDQRTTPCGPLLTVAQVRLSLVRCVRTVDSSGVPPSCADLLADAARLEVDRYTARATLACYLRSLRDSYQIDDFAVGAATSTGPQGMCAGFDLAYTVGVGSPCCS